MNPTLIIQSQLLATKFYVPTSPGTLIRRPRLSACALYMVGAGHLHEVKQSPYLDTLLAAFAKESKRPKRLPKQCRPRRLP